MDTIGQFSDEEAYRVSISDDGSVVAISGRKVTRVYQNQNDGTGLKQLVKILKIMRIKV